MDRRYRKRMDRHWAAAEAKGRHAIDRLDPSSWFDYWHTHVDWKGRGNRRVENRLAVYSRALDLLRYLDGRLSSRNEPIQTWATFCPNTMDTAVWAHSPNPNGSEFPRDFAEVDWVAVVPEEIATLVAEPYQVGAAHYSGEVVYLVRRRPNKSFKPNPLRGSA
jgi:hypothetical protein